MLAESDIQLFEELTLQSENQGLADVGDNASDALGAIGKYAGYIKQGAKFKSKSRAGLISSHY